MAKIDKKYVYFLYSEEQFKEKNSILASTGKSFSPGTVVVNGKRQKFTQIATEPKIDRFIDSIVVAEGYIDSFTYTEPTNSRKRGN